MRIIPFLIFAVFSGCSSKPVPSDSPDPMKISSVQLYLKNLKDSLKIHYFLAQNDVGKQAVLDNYFRRLKLFLWNTPMDSLRVTIDEVNVNGYTVTTKSHVNEMEFSGKITFRKELTPRLDSIYNFMKSLKPGTNVLLNMAFDGDFGINKPDSPGVPIFNIGAYPIPIECKSQ